MIPHEEGRYARYRSLRTAVVAALLLAVWLPLLAESGSAFTPANTGAENSTGSSDALVPMSLGLTPSDVLLQGTPDTQGSAPATPEFILIGSVGRSTAGLRGEVFPTGRRSGEFAASAHKLDLRGPSLRLEARFADVGSHFSPTGDGTAALAPEEVASLAREKGSRSADLSAGWDVGQALSLSTSQHTRRVDNPSDENYGLTSSQLAHALQLQLSGSTKIRATMAQEREQWGASVGRPKREKSERRIELTAGSGGSDANAFSAAVTSLSSVQDGRETAQRKMEAHLKLVPTAGLRLQADYLDSRDGNGEGEAATTLGAALSLGPQAQLSAHLKGRSGTGSQGGEAGLALSAALGGGRLTSELKQMRSEAGPQTWSKHSFAGALGRGPSQTNLRASLEQTRSDDAGGAQEGQASCHVDRWLSPKLQLVADWRAKQAGTKAEPTEESAASCRVQAKDLIGGELAVAIAQERDTTEASLQRLELVFSRVWKQLGLRFAQVSEAGPRRDGSSTAAYVDVRTGNLPAWATDGASPFEEAEKYLVRKSPIWGGLDMPFAGYRLWAVLRGDDQGSEPNTFGFAHRRVIGDRYHLQALFEEHPEMTEGPEKGRAQPFRRSFLELGSPVRAGVHARVGCGVDASMADDGGRLTRLGFGLWGTPGPLARLQADVSHESGRWEGAGRSRTSVSLLYTRHAGEDDHVDVKLGYAWGEDAGSESNRDCRLALGYEQPI